MPSISIQLSCASPMRLHLFLSELASDLESNILSYDSCVCVSGLYSGMIIKLFFYSDSSILCKLDSLNHVDLRACVTCFSENKA